MNLDRRVIHNTSNNHLTSRKALHFWQKVGSTMAGSNRQPFDGYAKRVLRSQTRYPLRQWCLASAALFVRFLSTGEDRGWRPCETGRNTTRSDETERRK